MITDSQAAYRDYLSSPLWKEIRAKAIEHYGAQCNSCGGPASDVHHKTYARVGGRESVDDLEVLCRPCHEAKHAVIRGFSSGQRKQKKPWIPVAVAYRYLNGDQKKAICLKYGIRLADLDFKYSTHSGVMLTMRNMLSVNIIEANKKAYQKLLRREVRPVLGQPRLKSVKTFGH